MNSSSRSYSPAIPHRRKHRNSSIAAVLCRQYGILGTPLFQCKLHKKNSSIAGISSPVNFRQGFPKREISARKLAAGLWQLRFMEVSGHGDAAIGDGSLSSSKSELSNGNVRIMLPTCHNTKDKFKKTKDLPRRPFTVLSSRNGIRCELESSLPCLKCCKEEATKWDPGLSEASNEFTQIHSSKHDKERKLIGDSVVSALLAELLQAQRCINKLKAARKSSKKRAEQFVQKFEEEKICWKRRELQKIQAMLDDIKDRWERERRSRERMELMNAKLVHELAKANLSAKHFMKNYEEEKRGRELMEEVCNELAKQIGEDKGRLEELQRESMKIREEVEEERKMMQLAELLREERVQMKLVDAKVALEDKYYQMIQLIAYLQTFLRSRGAEIDTMDLREAALIKQAAESVKIQGIVELSYDFSKSYDIFSLYEELRKDEDDERVIKPYFHPGPTIPSSTTLISSPDEDGLNNSKLHQSSSSTDYNTGLEVDNAWVTVNHVEGKDSSSPPQRRDTPLDNVNQDNNILWSEVECSENTYLKSPTEVCSASVGQLKGKVSSASKLRSCTSNGTTSTFARTSQHKKPVVGGLRYQDSAAQENSVDFVFDECNPRLSTGSIQRSGITSPCKGSDEGSFKHWEPVGQQNSTDFMNPHISRGIKGCIERPRGVPKGNLKAIPLDARVRSQKSQLQHILKPKA